MTLGRSGLTSPSKTEPLLRRLLSFGQGQNRPMALGSESKGRKLVLTFASSKSELRRARKAVREWLNRVGQPVGHWDVVVTELLCNAIDATSGDESSLLMKVECEDGLERVSCTVRNDGVWDVDGLTTPAALDHVVARHPRPGDGMPTGRGLRIVNELTSGGLLDVEGGSTVVKVWLDLAPAS